MQDHARFGRAFLLSEEAARADCSGCCDIDQPMLLPEVLFPITHPCSSMFLVREISWRKIFSLAFRGGRQVGGPCNNFASALQGCVRRKGRRRDQDTQAEKEYEGS